MEPSPRVNHLLEYSERFIKGAGDTVRIVTGTLSGASIEHQVRQYSELYTQVLLAVHQSLEAQARRTEEQQRRIDSLEKQMASLRVTRNIALGALGVAAASLGGVAWLAI